MTENMKRKEKNLFRNKKNNTMKEEIKWAKWAQGPKAVGPKGGTCSRFLLKKTKYWWKAHGESVGAHKATAYNPFAFVWFLFHYESPIFIEKEGYA